MSEDVVDVLHICIEIEYSQWGQTYHQRVYIGIDIIYIRTEMRATLRACNREVGLVLQRTNLSFSLN